MPAPSPRSPTPGVLVAAGRHVHPCRAPHQQAIRTDEMMHSSQMDLGVISLVESPAHSAQHSQTLLNLRGTLKGDGGLPGYPCPFCRNLPFFFFRICAHFADPCGELLNRIKGTLHRVRATPPGPMAVQHETPSEPGGNSAMQLERATPTGSSASHARTDIPVCVEEEGRRVHHAVCLCPDLPAAAERNWKGGSSGLEQAAKVAVEGCVCVRLCGVRM